MTETISSSRVARETQIQPLRPRGVGVVATIDLIMGGLSVLGGISAVATGVQPVAAPTGLGFLQGLAPELPALLL